MHSIHFGAGNIGRGFIGLLLSQAGYSVTFVDVNKTLVDLINSTKQYTVQYANAERDSFLVENVQAIVGSDETAITEAIVKADMITTAVGVNILKYIAPAIAEGLSQRAKLNLPPIPVVACENAIRASSILKSLVMEQLSPELVQKIDTVACFPDAAVDRIVPIQKHDDPLLVVVEPFYEWIIEQKLWPDHLEPIAGVQYVDVLDPYIERKLFTVNTGHCSVAFLGQLQGYETIQEAMQDEKLVDNIISVLEETGAALIAHYQLDANEHRSYIQKIISRFKNPFLTDEISRVGRSPIRKLSPNDRLVRPASLAAEHHIEVNYLPQVMAAGLMFNAEDDAEVQQLHESIDKHGVDFTITKYTELNDLHPLHKKIKHHYEKMLNEKHSMKEA